MTVRQGTKEFNQALDGAVKVCFFSLHNGFVGRGELKEDNPHALMNSRAYLRALLRQFRFARLIRVGAGKYTLRVHSNEWYEFEIAAPGTGN